MASTAIIEKTREVSDQDNVFAQLTELFGDIMSPNIIISVCKEHNWDCKLIFYYRVRLMS